MTAKRAFDIALALALLVPGLPIMAVLWGLVALRDGRPAIYVSQRMKAPGAGFDLYKFRTMRLAGPERGVSGGDKAGRITALGRRLRRMRLDELPQLVNVLRGDMSFVGPRPPARQYVEQFPALYAEVLRSRPGITGLATILYHSHEEMLLKPCRTAEETHAVYVRRCIPRKAALDRLYTRRQSLGLDLYILYLTLGKLMPLPGARLRRLRAKAARV
ncbi:sugar transferase [Vannielia litorea]|uniref:Sugar transferase involved in LPS biosynthesis (Colanic, teichoic acid) n=1 Tax=Vannielia litorea TaxID=1217970 RepID=A0A1N6HMA6_9RHOB|nr:sugar transferase [Vannielia litorea]SIO20988.1 Sugar transferase involved in LPS biosynthesis (colanic, teichoic acid) [Vannielia litorea]